MCIVDANDPLIIALQEYITDDHSSLNLNVYSLTTIFLEQAENQKGCTLVMQIARPTNSYKKAHNTTRKKPMNIAFLDFSYQNI